MSRFLAIFLFSGTLAIAQTNPAPPVRQEPPPVSTVQGPNLPPPNEPAPLAPTPAAPIPVPLTEKLREFSPTEVKLGWHNRHWQLTHNGDVLKDFGLREQDARQALRVIQELRLNQYGTVGSPAVMEYWLRDGFAPQGEARLTLRPIPLDSAQMRVEQMQGKWYIREGQRVLFGFHRQEDADQALTVMKKYHFDQLGTIGQSAPMYVFLSRTPGTTPTATDKQDKQGKQTQPFSRLAKNSDGTPKGDKTSNKNAGVPQPGLTPVVNPTPAGNAAGRIGNPSHDPVGRISNPSHDTQLPASREKAMWRTQPQPGPKTLPGAQPDRLPFDWRQVQVRQQGADWTLVSGSQVLANFGANLNEARLALSAVRYYRFTELHRVGGAQPAVNYCTPSLLAPRGVMLGLHAQVLMPEQMAVQPLGEGYALYSGNQVVMKVGEHAEARRLVELIKSNKYDRLCQIGEPGKDGMTILVRSR
jgi:hypothetical protein